MSQSTPSSVRDDAERRIEAVAEEYLAELQAGTRPDIAALVAAHADIAEPLRKRLALVERLFKAARGIDGQRFPVERARRLKCPHCGNQIQLVEPRPKEVTCVNCGSSFRVEPGTTTTYRAAGPGGTIGRFEIAELLGRGAFGEVYKAHDPKLDRDVALKIPRADTFATREEEERFVREARSCARLVHPGIVQVHEVARDGNLPYIVSDYVEGLTLADLLTGGRPGFRDSAEILAQLADALDYAHRQGVVHRDVKPSNILLSRSDGGKYRPHLTDFGLARRDEGEITITLDGQVLGTPAYMSPEQAAGEHAKIDGRSDVYSVGVVLYELLTGDLPFRGNKRMLLHQVLHDDPRPPRRVNDRIPRDLETICLKAMSKDISRRYGSAGDFADDLRRWLRGDAIRARPVGRVEKVWRWGKRNRALASLASLLLLAMAVGTAISSLFAVRANRTASRLAVEKDRSDDHLAQARRNLYINRMNLARVAWEKGDTARVVELLEPYAEPEPNEPELRGWEWYYQQRLCHDELRRFVASPGPADSARIADFAFSPSGERIVLIAAGKDEQFVQLFDVATGRSVKKVTVENPTNIFINPEGIAVSPDGRLLAIGGNDGDVGLFDSSSGRRLGTLKGHTGRISGVAFSPNGRLLLSAGTDGTARLWDVETRTERNKIDLRDEDKDSSRELVQNVVWSPSGQQIGLCHGSQVAVWDVNPLMELFQMETEFTFLSFCFSPDGMRIALARSEFSLAHRITAEVWDLKSHTKVCTYETHLTQDSMFGPIYTKNSTVAFNPTGDHVVCCVGDSLRIWDAHTGAEIRVLRGHAGPVQLVAYSPEGSLIASLAPPGDLRLWSSAAEPESRPLVLSDWHQRMGQLFAFSPNGKRIVISLDRAPRVDEPGQDHAAAIWDLERRQTVAHIGPSDGDLRSLAYSHDGKYIATLSETGAVKVWHAESGDLAKTLPTHGAPTVQHIVFAPNDGRLAMVQSDGLIRIWDIDANRGLCEFRTHPDGVRSLAVSATRRQLATLGNNGFAKIWDYERGAEVLSISVSKPNRPSSQVSSDLGGVNNIAFSPVGKILITALGDPQAWDTTTGKLLRTFRGHSSPWRGLGKGPSIFEPGLAISPDGNRLATCSFEDNTVKVWDMLTGEEVRTLEAGAMPTAVAFSPDGSILATSSQDGIMLWDARPMTRDVEVERNACAVVNFAYERLPLKEEAIEFIRSNRMISEPVRQKALQFADVYSFPHTNKNARRPASDEEAARLNVASWKIGALPYQAPALYQCYVSF